MSITTTGPKIEARDDGAFELQIAYVVSNGSDFVSLLRDLDEFNATQFVATAEFEEETTHSQIREYLSGAGLRPCFSPTVPR